DIKNFSETLNDPFYSINLTDKVVKTILDLPEEIIDLSIHKEIGSSLISNLDLDEVQENIVKSAIKLLNVQEGALWVCTKKNKNSLQMVYNYCLSNMPTEVKRIIKIGDGLVGVVARALSPKLINNPKNQEHYDPAIDCICNENVDSMIVIPLLFRGELLGVLQLVNKRNQELFTSKDLSIISSLADYASISLKNAQIHQQTQELTITDDHSRLYNFRFLDTTLEKFIDHARRYQRNLSLIFMDLDNLKFVNDNHGHLMGSKLLSQIADLILPIIRSADLAVRYGGDEFVIMLPETDTDGALNLAERLRKKLEENFFLKDEKLNIRVTGSFGVATYPSHAHNKEKLLKAADEAMYEAKRTSKNRVCISRKREDDEEK
ncbi:sensor domain-containing diguanylate cyclase, partial [bacterium]|nr:sensor domain-containing diguanylate cyclase [bacterium]